MPLYPIHLIIYINIVAKKQTIIYPETIVAK
jgi:hypothetical protein